MKDGSVKAQGEKVTQVYVDGKPFFGNDPKMITQNLPADIIDKIQIIDKKSEKAIATKVEDGQNEKIINITIKKNRNSGYFGRAYAGLGTAERYEGKVSANHFNKDKKVSFVTSVNNTGRNDYGNGEEEYTSYNNYNGITKDYQTKLSFTDKWGKKLDVNANIGYNNNQNKSEQFRNRQNIFADSSNYYAEHNLSTRNRCGITTGVGFEYKPDTLTTIRFNQNGFFGKNTYQTAALFNSKLLNNKTINEGNRTNTGISNSPSFNGNLSITRRFKKARRAMFFNMNNNINNSLSDAFNNSNNYFFPVNGAEYLLLVNQYLNNKNKTTNVSSSVSYSEPLSKKSTINMSFSYNFNNNNTIREAFNFNNISGLYDLLNDTLTNRFRSNNYNATIGTNYSYSLKKGVISLGATWQDAVTKSTSLTKDSIYKQKYSGIVPYANFNISNKGKRFSANYNFNNRPPQPYQLQPVVDNTNPLYVRLGNPNLKYATTHRVNMNFTYYNAKKQTSIYANGTITTTANNISTSNIYDRITGRQISQPINVNGVRNANGNINFNKPFKIFKHKLSWNNNAKFNTGRNVSEINMERNINNTLGGNISTGLNFEVDDKFQVELKSNVSIQTTKYSLQPNLNNTYYTFGSDYNIEIDLGRLTEIRINGNFSKNTGRTAGFNRNIHMINGDVTQYFSQKKLWWLKFKVYDLLKQNLNVFRYSGENYIEDIQSNVLTRFFLLSINFKLAKFKAKN
jgi:hypothetical protein